MLALMGLTLVVMLSTYVAAYITRARRLGSKRQCFTLEHVEVTDLRDGSTQIIRFDEVQAVRIHTTFLQHLLGCGNLTFEPCSGQALTLTDVAGYRTTALELMALCGNLGGARMFAQNALITTGRSWRPSSERYAGRRDLKFMDQVYS